MPEQTKLFVVAVLTIVLAMFWTEHASQAAEECMASPNAPPPQGSHWYYRTDRSTNQKCWYLGAQGAKVRATAPPEAAVRMPLPKPTVRSAEGDTAADVTAEPAASDPKTAKNDALASRYISSSVPATPDIAREPTSTITASAEMKHRFHSGGDEPFDLKPAQPIDGSSLPTEVVGEPISKTRAYAEAQTSTRFQAAAPVAWSVSPPAEPAASSRSAEPIITFVHLLVAFLAALGLVFVVVRAVCSPATIRTLGQFMLGRRPGLTPDVPGSARNLFDSAATQTDVSRPQIEQQMSVANDSDVHIEASVQRLLRELKRRQPDHGPHDYECARRKITA
jgi:hypothetical protein